MKGKSNASMALARQVKSFGKGEYKGLDMRNLVIRPGALDVLSKPSLMGGKRYPYKSVFKQEREDGSE